jgi:hypothetical protein
MTPDEVEADKLAWFECWKMIKDLPRERIIQLLNLMPDDKREDCRRRLNILRENRSKNEKGLSPRP